MIKTIVLACAILFLAGPLLMHTGAPTVEGASRWSQWSTWSYVNRKGTKECARGLRTANGRDNLWPQCRIATHWRKRFVVQQGEWVVKDVQLQSIGLFYLYGVTSTANVRYNGTQVFGSNGCSSWGIGYSIDVTWCAIENDGGANGGFLRYGATYKVGFLWNDAPLQASHWMRERVHVDGGICCATGG